MAVLLSGCAPGSAGPNSSVPAASAGGGTSSEDTGGDDGTAVTLPGTGKYVIGKDAPFGGYQLVGEPDAQPAGCTWSIQDADGTVNTENQGIYVFLEDVKESVTFVTDGCPDWQKFE